MSHLYFGNWLGENCTTAKTSWTLTSFFGADTASLRFISEFLWVFVIIIHTAWVSIDLGPTLRAFHLVMYLALLSFSVHPGPFMLSSSSDPWESHAGAGSGCTKPLQSFSVDHMQLPIYRIPKVHRSNKNFGSQIGPCRSWRFLGNPCNGSSSSLFSSNILARSASASRMRDSRQVSSHFFLGCTSTSAHVSQNRRFNTRFKVPRNQEKHMGSSVDAPPARINALQASRVCRANDSLKNISSSNSRHKAARSKRPGRELQSPQ